MIRVLNRAIANTEETDHGMVARSDPERRLPDGYCLGGVCTDDDISSSVHGESGGSVAVNEARQAMNSIAGHEMPAPVNP